MNSQELRTRVREYCRQHEISVTKFARINSIPPATMSNFMNAKYSGLSQENYDKFKRGLSRKCTEVKFDLADPNAYIDMLKIVTEKKEMLDSEIARLEDQLAELYKLKEMMSK